MPKNLKNVGVKKQRMERRKNTVQETALSDPTAVFGRATKALGRKNFMVYAPDPTAKPGTELKKTILVEAVAHVEGANAPWICVNDMVVLTHDGREFRIMSNMDRKTEARLRKENRIHPQLTQIGSLEEEDDGITFGEDDEKEGDEEIDVDDI